MTNSKKNLVLGNSVFVYDILGNLLMVIARDTVTAETQVTFPGYSILESAGRIYVAITAAFRGETFNLNQVERQLAAANADVANALRIMAESKAVNPNSIISPVEMPESIHDAVQAAAIAFKGYCRENGIPMNSTSPYAVASKQLFKLLSLESQTWAYDLTVITTAIAQAFVAGWSQVKFQVEQQIEQLGVDTFRTETSTGTPAQGSIPANAHGRRALVGAGAQG
jgi:hypothetical protein